jgi:hypothetical protein
MIKNPTDNVKNPYATLGTFNVKLGKLTALAFFILTLVPAAREAAGLGGSGVLQGLGILLAGSVLLRQPLASLSLAFELKLMEKIPFEEIERRTQANLEAFRQEMKDKQDAQENERSE